MVLNSLDNKFCEGCNKLITLTEDNKYYFKKLKFCSNYCAVTSNFKIWAKNCPEQFKIHQSNAGKKGGNKAFLTHKRNKTGLYGISYEERVENTKKANETNKRNGTGFWDKNTSIKAGKTATQKYGGWFGVKKWAKEHPDDYLTLHKRNGKISGQKVAKILRIRKKIFLNNVYYDSYRESEFALNITHQFVELKEGKNYQFKIKDSDLDFFIEEYKCFIEFHPYNSLYDKEDVTLSNYETKRRDLLDKNGYKDYNLIIIKN